MDPEQQLLFVCPHCGTRQPFRWPPDLFAGEDQTPIWRCPDCGHHFGYYQGMHGKDATPQEIANRILDYINRGGQTGVLPHPQPRKPKAMTPERSAAMWAVLLIDKAEELLRQAEEHNVDLTDELAPKTVAWRVVMKTFEQAVHAYTLAALDTERKES